MRRHLAIAAAALAGAVLLPAVPMSAQAVRTVDPSLYAGLHWRNIGPFRGGRAVAVSGVPGDARTFYMGTVGGGVWKTGNAGRTWAPIMDSQPVASIGAIAVAPRDPEVVYVGSGEADMRSNIQHGNGIYKSTDAGTTWARIGLEDSRQIGRILVDPRNSGTLLVAALGHAYAPNDTRGVYRSVDGGATWTRTLFKDRDTGAIDLASDPSMHTVYASLWQTRRPPWSVYPPSYGPGSGLYKSTDGGVTWNQLQGHGFPSEGLGKIGLAVAPSDPKRVYAIVDAKAGGLYRSDDGGDNWALVDKDKRLWDRGWYFCHVTVDPRNADIVYVSDTAFYRSTDGGSTFTAIKGSPDGDDFQGLWVDPTEPARMILTSDQGAVVSIDGAKTWSSWFNQPTAQFYRVATDNAFPYRLYGAQQDSGAAMIVSRSAHAGIQERDWRPINAGGESGMIAPDPRDTNVVYGNTAVREYLDTAQTRTLSPTTARPGTWRAEWTQPLAFGPDHALYTANQVVFRSRDNGAHWQTISRDLSRPHAGVPATLDPTTAKDADSAEPRGVVYSLAPSPLRANVLWAGTDDGLVHLTRDGGKTWRNVTPPAVTPWSHVDTIEASRFDERTAYVAVDRHRLDDDAPYLYVTHDAGRTWRAATSGIGPTSHVWVVREDPRRRGLLYAGTETGVFVSFDDGAAWQSLRLNMPVASVHDISVHGDDLAIATHGRAFWILDDVTPLRQLAANAAPDARLFAPADAVRTRPYNDEAESSPPEVPMGENPPFGAPIDYVVPAGEHGVVGLVIANAAGRIVRAWSSTDAVTPVDPNSVPYPAYWLVQPARLAAEPGMHRFVWDFHSATTSSGRRRRGGGGPFVPPGRYAVHLTVGGRTLIQPLTIRRDPRIHATDADLVAQYALAHDVDALLARVQRAVTQAADARKKPGADVAKINAVAGAPGTTSFTTLSWYASALNDLLGSIESADSAPTADERAAWASLRPKSEAALLAWTAVLK
ncbi:MAG: hypothetical protein QOF71_3005 [Candidatus Eremiobacteraeota bacterium]|nr:hypothetical protein [Candidatus Eremiobacteraeota bacterium]